MWSAIEGVLSKTELNYKLVESRHEIMHTNYNLQFRIDSDDFVSPKIIEHALNYVSKIKEEKFVIGYQIFKYVTKTGDLYTTRKYTSERQSMTACLYCMQPEDKDWVYGCSHSDIGRIYKSCVINYGYAVLNLHGGNVDTSEIKSFDKKLETGLADNIIGYELIAGIEDNLIGWTSALNLKKAQDLPLSLSRCRGVVARARARKNPQNCR